MTSSCARISSGGRWRSAPAPGSASWVRASRRTPAGCSTSPPATGYRTACSTSTAITRPRSSSGGCACTSPTSRSSSSGGSRILRNPSTAKLSELLGIGRGLPEPTCDLLVVGAGPAGLAATVYAASDGLSVVLSDAVATGGRPHAPPGSRTTSDSRRGSRALNSPSGPVCKRSSSEHPSSPPRTPPASMSRAARSRSGSPTGRPSLREPLSSHPGWSTAAWR
ncbi:FAD-binding protein [Leifsonia sp. L25]|uniref:FAD-binding protein n=1 Tax=Leifsonia sp. L25 TaxID=3423957 RepID=UPI003D68CAC7